MRKSRMKFESGMKLHKLTLIKLVERRKNGHLWLMECECGNRKILPANNVRSGDRKSCGCLGANALVKHGQTRNGKQSTEYNIWKGMRARCNNSNHPWYKRYGGRGIKICDRWSDFKYFLEDMGKRPSSKHSLDRIDNNKGYCADNCKWSTQAEQVRNCVSNRICTLLDRDMCVTDAIRTLGIRSSVTWHYINGLGMTPNAAIIEIAKQDGVNINDYK